MTDQSSFPAIIPVYGPGLLSHNQQLPPDRLVIGIDPGRFGGIAVLREGQLALCAALPLMENVRRKTEVDAEALRKLILPQWGLHQSKTAPDLVLIEDVWAHKGEGPVGAYTFGRGTGKILGCLEALWGKGCYKEVLPEVWKRHALAGTDHGKDAAIAVVEKLFPETDLRRTEKCKTKSDGMAEAVCIALYAWARVTGQVLDQPKPVKKFTGKKNYKPKT